MSVHQYTKCRFVTATLPSKDDLGFATLPIPYAENLHVPAVKLDAYLLDPDHPFGGGKAEWFARQGYHRGNHAAALDSARDDGDSRQATS